MQSIRFTIWQVMVFTALIAVQIQSPEMIELGFGLTFLAIPTLILLMIISAFASGAQDGQLNTAANPVFKLVSVVIIWCVLNLIIMYVLNRMFPPLPTYLDH